jgi:hypothetical protein
MPALESPSRNHHGINTLVHVPNNMSDEEATLVVTAGTSMYGLDVLGGLIAGEGVVVTGPGPIGLLGVADELNRALRGRSNQRWASAEAVVTLRE